jgi:phage shock protein A
MAASEPAGPAWPGDTSGLLDALGDHERATVQRLAHAEIELEHKRALLEVLDHEQARLQGAMARLEDELDDLDAEMLLCLARDREDHAHTAIRRIIPRRRRVAALRAGIDRIATERARLAGSVSRQSRALRAGSAPRQGWELHELPARASTPLSSHRSARSRVGAPGPAFSSAALASPGRPLRAPSREHRGESI